MGFETPHGLKTRHIEIIQFFTYNKPKTVGVLDISGVLLRASKLKLRSFYGIQNCMALKYVILS